MRFLVLSIFLNQIIILTVQVSWGLKDLVSTSGDKIERIRQSRASPVTSNNLTKQTKYLSWSTDAYCGKEFGLDWNFTAGFGIFDLVPNASPQRPRLGDISVRPPLNLSLHWNMLLYKGWNKVSHGVGLYLHIPSPPLPALSFPPCLVGQAAASLMLWLQLRRGWPAGRFLPLVTDKRPKVFFPFWGCPGDVKVNVCLKCVGWHIWGISASGKQDWKWSLD